MSVAVTLDVTQLMCVTYFDQHWCVPYLHFIKSACAAAHEKCLIAWSMRLSTSEPAREPPGDLNPHTTHETPHDRPHSVTENSPRGIEPKFMDRNSYSASAGETA